MAKKIEDDEEIIYVSKSEMKRDMDALQKLGESIVKLSAGQLATIPLEGKLQEAIDTARRIKHREGLRRQMQYIGKLMRSEDTEAIEAAMLQLTEGARRKTHQLKAMENWRDELIEKGNAALTEVLEKFPQADRQHLRQLISLAQKKKKLDKPPSASRILFRYLRELEDSQHSE